MAHQKPGLDAQERNVNLTKKSQVFKDIPLSNLLFICSKNRWRSPTAEMLFKNHPVHHARSAGTSDKAKIKVNQKLIEWATVIFVMEQKHKELLKQRFAGVVIKKQIIVLGIEDDYKLNDPELIEILKGSLSGYL